VDTDADHKMNLAGFFSKWMSPKFVYNSVDAVSRAMYGAELKAKDFWDRLGNTFKEAAVRSEIGRYGQRNFAEETDYNDQHIKELKKQLPPPERTLSDVPKSILQSLYGLGYLGVHAAGFVATDMAAFLSGEQMSKSMGLRTLTHIEPYTEMEAERLSGQFVGTVYQSIRDRGIDPTIARSVAGGMGLFQAVMFGLPISKLPGVRALEDAAINEALARVALNGGIDSVLRVAGKKIAATAAQQGAYNIINATVQTTVPELATALNNKIKGTDLPQSTVGDIFKEMGLSVLGGTTAMTIAGIPGSFSEASILHRAMQKEAIRALADPSLASITPGEAPEPAGAPPSKEQMELVRLSPEPETAIEKTTVPAPEQPEGRPSFRAEDVPIARVRQHPDVPNFKERFEPLGGTYDRAGSAPIVLMEGRDGELYMVTGRHRLDLAQRSGEKSIPAHIFREADGFTPEMARVWDSESNIRDGQGTVKDYAKYFRGTGITEQQASERGLLARAKGKNGFAVGSYASDELFSAFENNAISESRAAAITRGAPRDAIVQVEAMRASDVPIDQLENFTAALAREKASTTAGQAPEQAELFGFDPTFSEQLRKEARAASTILSRMKDEQAALKSALRVSGPDRSKYLEPYGTISLDNSQIEARIGDLATQIQSMENWRNNRELHNLVREKAGLPPMEYTVAPELTLAERSQEQQQQQLFGAKEEEILRAQNEPLPDYPARQDKGTDMILKDSAAGLEPVQIKSQTRSNPDIIWNDETPVDKKQVIEDVLFNLKSSSRFRKDMMAGESPSKRTAIRRAWGRTRGAYNTLGSGYDFNAELVFGGKDTLGYKIAEGYLREKQLHAARQTKDYTKPIMVDGLKSLDAYGPVKTGNFALQEFTEDGFVLNRGEIWSLWMHYQDANDNRLSALKGLYVPRAENPLSMIEHPMPEETMLKFFNHLSEPEKALLNRSHEILLTLGRLRRDNHWKMHGEELPLIENYFRKLVYRGDKDVPMYIEDMMEGWRWMQIVPNEKSSIARENVIVPLILRNFFQEFPEIVRDTMLLVNMGPHLQQAGKILFDPRVSLKIEQTWGRTMLRSMKDNLQLYAERGGSPASWVGTLNEIADFVRSPTISLDLGGLSVKPGLKQMMLGIRSALYMPTILPRGDWLKALIESVARPGRTRQIADAISDNFNVSRRMGGTIELSTMLNDATSFNKSPVKRALLGARTHIRRVSLALTKSLSNWSFKVDTMAALHFTEREVRNVMHGGQFTEDFKAATGFTEKDAPNLDNNVISRLKAAGRYADYIQQESHATSFSSQRAGLLQTPVGRLFGLFKAEALKASESMRRPFMQARRAVQAYKLDPTEYNHRRSMMAISKAVKAGVFYLMAEPAAFYALDQGYATLMGYKHKPSPIVSGLLTLGSYVLGLGDVIRGIIDRIQYSSAATSTAINVAGQEIGYLSDGVIAVYHMAFNKKWSEREKAWGTFWNSILAVGLSAMDVGYQFPNALFRRAVGKDIPHFARDEIEAFKRSVGIK
jgi:hypothetical protein